jgi:hypothetical protein
MKDHEIQVDDDTSSILEAIAQAEDDPLLIAEMAQVNPTEFRQFISECGGVEDENATELLKAAESLQRVGINREEPSNRRSDSSDSLSTRLPSPRSIIQPLSPFRLILILNIGLGLGISYGLLGTGLISYYNGIPEAQNFFAVYTSSFKTLISLGLILGTGLIVNRTLDVIPKTIEAAFTETQLSETNYFSYKQRFFSLQRSISISIESIILAFIIFSYCQFPLSSLGQALMLIAVCAEYGIAAYICRKIMYSGMILHSLLRVTITRDLFRRRELDAINTYVNVISMLTVIFVCVHVIVYYNGPFLYSSFLGQSIKTFLLLPALIVTPLLLILNFYPRAVLRKLYDHSIDFERRRFKKALENEELSAFEKRYYLIEFEKMSRDELRSYATLTLGDLPIMITILIMVEGLLLWQ